MRVMESLAGVRDAKNILMGKRIDGGSPLIHALVSAAISGHETLEAQQVPAKLAFFCFIDCLCSMYRAFDFLHAYSRLELCGHLED